MNDSISTYIMYDKLHNKYYCGKTNNITERMLQHTKDKYKNYKLILRKKLKVLELDYFIILVLTV